jgi:hypothetical protein
MVFFRGVKSVVKNIVKISALRILKAIKIAQIIGVLPDLLGYRG